MSAPVHEATSRLLELHGAQSGPAHAIDLVLIGLVAALLVEFDLFRAYHGERGEMKVREFELVLVPLLIAFVIIIVARWTALR